MSKESDRVIMIEALDMIYGHTIKDFNLLSTQSLIRILMFGDVEPSEQMLMLYEQYG